MASDTTSVCKFCSKPISAEMIFDSTIVCKSCGLTDTIPKSNRNKNLAIFGGILVFIIAGIFYLKDPVTLVWNPNHAFKSMTKENALKAVTTCTQYNDRDCLIAAYERLDELDVTNPEYRGNLAMELTRAQRYGDAEDVFAKMIENNEMTPSLMAFHALALENLNKTDDAIQWYKKSLAIEPDVHDITVRLTALLMNVGRPEEAKRVASTFTAKFPEYKKDLRPVLQSKAGTFLQETKKPE